MKCKNKVELGQGSNANCGDKWGDTPILCDICRWTAKRKCKDCKHWDYQSYIEACGDKGLCDKHSHERGDDTSKCLAEAICYGEGIEGELMTMPDFGCIEFEAKE